TESPSPIHTLTLHDALPICCGVEDLRHITGLEHSLAEPAAAFGLNGLDDLHLAPFPYLRSLVEEVGALGEGELRPFREGGLCGLDRRSCFGTAGIGNFRPDRTVCGVQILEGLRSGRPAAANIHALENTSHFKPPCAFPALSRYP